MSPALMQYQEEGSDFLAAHDRCGLFDDMGLGKTAQAIRALDKRHLVKGIIVCPAAVRQAWLGEFAKFANIPRNVFKASEPHDLAAWKLGIYDVIIISYEMAAKWTCQIVNDCILMDFVILDESHYLKSRAALRTQEILGLECAGNGLTQWAETVWYLTGTPMPNDPMDIHPFLYSSGATNLDRNAFRREFFDYGGGASGTSNSVKEEKIDELRALIGSCSMRRTQKTAGVNIPPIFITDTSIDGDTSAVRKMLLDHPGLDQRIIGAVHSDEGIAGLNMIVAGHIATLRRLIGEAKALPYAELLLEELDSGLDKIVVFGVHKRAIEMLATHLGENGIKCVTLIGGTRENDRVANVKAFQEDPGVRVFIGNIKAAGVGLTLTASNRLDMFESDWTPAGNAQAIKRVHRITQTRQVTARFITLANSFDEVVNEIVAEKTQRLAAIDDLAAAYAVH
jgi:SWI/SNF-related matrix-associated actin-dependent regulator of chromatin subfamily A-like protein 1